MAQINYDRALEEYLIKEFIRENKRSPNPVELLLLKRRGEKQFPGIAQVGFSGHLITKPQYASESIASDENNNREAIYTDIALADEWLEDLVFRLENTFRGLYATQRNIKRRLDSVESRIDNVLLLTNSTDFFVHAVEEDFGYQDVIDFTKTTASVEGGYCSMGRAGFGLVNLDDVTITHSTLANRGYIGFQNTSPIDSLKADDGTFWEHIVYTNYTSGRVSVVIDINLDTPAFVSEFRFTGSTSSVNSQTKATVFYSFDGKTYKAVSPEEYVVLNNESVFNIGQDDVKTIRLVLSKDRYDTTANISNQYVYLFSLDSIKLYSEGYTADGQSVLYAGPYTVYDSEGNEVAFTKATCELCMSSGDETAVATYLSIDGENYKAVDTSGMGLGIVTFENSDGDLASVLLDDTLTENRIIDQPVVSLDTNDVLLNKAVDADYVDSFIQKSVVIKRNIPYEADGSRPQVYKGISGWDYLSDKRSYRTTVSITNPEGLGIDLGATTAMLNGLPVTGQIVIPTGISVFETNETNWFSIPAGLTTQQAVRKADPLYPYNHKHLIEGYTYPDMFIGDRIYLGVDEYFGQLLTYVSPEVFSTRELDGDLSIYTIDDTDGFMFKVKANKADGTWSNEYFDVSWMISRGGYNKLWLKLILNSSDEYVSPIVSSVKMRVI